MNSKNLPNTFFFDLPLTDVHGAGCAALSMIYHGSASGAFGGSRKGAVDLSQVQSFQISLNHRTVEPLSDGYDYYLVYYLRELDVDVWSNRSRRTHKALRELTRRVKLTLRASIRPSRLRRFYLKSNRPVHIAIHDGGVPTDNCVPLEYIEQFDQLFEGFLMRCKKGYLLAQSIFDSQGLVLMDQRDVRRPSATSPSVMIYSDLQGVEVVEQKSKIERLVDLSKLVKQDKVLALEGVSMRPEDEDYFELDDEQNQKCG